ncbi:MAG: hypothetical protein K1W35_14045 [Lachnospiraceae bacterium]
MRVNSNYELSSITLTNRSGENALNDVEKTFSDVITMKATETDKESLSEKVSESIDLFGPNSPDEVKQAWMEAEEETGVHIAKAGLYISPDGEHACFTRLAGQIAVKWAKGELNETDQVDLLGNSVESAINAVNKWIYDLDHPLAGQPARSIDEQRLIMQERAFYEAFLEKLEVLSDKRVFE